MHVLHIHEQVHATLTKVSWLKKLNFYIKVHAKAKKMSVIMPLFMYM